MAREEEALFRRSWQYVGHAGMLPPGSAHATELGGVPVVVTRGDAGEFHALVNVCRHRGAIVCPEDGPTPSLRCPYHAWTYGLDGALRSAPRAQLEGPIDFAAHALTALPIATWGPFIFVSPDPIAPPLPEVLGELPERVAAAGVDIDGLRFVTRAHSEIRANWKICVENFLECYHCRVAHPDFAAAMATGGDDFRLETTATFSSQYAPTREERIGAYELRGPVAEGQFHVIYPNTAINILPGRPNFSIGPITPSGPQRTKRFLDYFAGPDVDDAWIAAMIEFDDQVGAEDRALVEGVQRGMAAAMHEHGTLLPESERLVAHFADYIRNALA